MPLPPALAARLAKRGLLQPPPPPAETNLNADNEEIIAEDYDSKPEQRKEKYWAGVVGISVDPVKGHSGCPNKYNIYHECSSFCVRKWKNGKVKPDDEYLELQKLLLEKWPLPAGWTEVYDPGVGQHYYWNSYNNMVSWLPPSHPNSVVGESAIHLREERLLKEGDVESEASSDSDQEVPQQERERKTPKKKFSNHKTDKRVKIKSSDLDPMDPAAYSDIPRGQWGAGLERNVVTGVDSTATGPLFQQRPYPSPGAILAANAKNKRPPSPESP